MRDLCTDAKGSFESALKGQPQNPLFPPPKTAIEEARLKTLYLMADDILKFIGDCEKRGDTTTLHMMFELGYMANLYAFPIAVGAEPFLQREVKRTNHLAAKIKATAATYHAALLKHHNEWKVKHQRPGETEGQTFRRYVNQYKIKGVMFYKHYDKWKSKFEFQKPDELAALKAKYTERDKLDQELYDLYMEAHGKEWLGHSKIDTLREVLGLSRKKRNSSTGLQAR
jgi:hypothetical protein